MQDNHGEITIFPYFKQVWGVCDRTHPEAYESLWISKLSYVNKISPFRICERYDERAEEAEDDEGIGVGNRKSEFEIVLKCDLAEV
ncbi:TPA: hypothetical protein N0F65_001713 [Lagenidium giganteum]|uniref:Uncharacterized protein n=1 Tax=Lagenidium giganteum TaxID=4803 RepID=A0AAV2Z8Y1_9STRA|nr:TPA: hypothetical protein N0F65_001713 [Lagenidium giganteum]